MADSAPAHIRFCVRCGAEMEVRDLAGLPRKACQRCDHVHFTDPKVGVGVVVLRENRLLLVRRAMEPERGKWALPGGFLDAGEDPRAKAAQEAWEEAGVEVEVTEVVDVFGGTTGGADLFVLYAARWVSGEPRAGDDADGAAFFDADALPELAFESTRESVRRWSHGDRVSRVVEEENS